MEDVLECRLFGSQIRKRDMVLSAKADDDSNILSLFVDDFAAEVELNPDYEFDSDLESYEESLK